VATTAALSQRRITVAQTRSHGFATLAAAGVPLLGFFLLLQFEGFAPLLNRQSIWQGHWNPVINTLRFGALMIGVILLAVWAADISRFYQSLRFKESARRPS
jgi:hypothetical protein